MGLYSGGLIIGRIFASEIWGAYFREGLFFGGLIIGILRYFMGINFILIKKPPPYIFSHMSFYFLLTIEEATTKKRKSEKPRGGALIMFWFLCFQKQKSLEKAY